MNRRTHALLTMVTTGFLVLGLAGSSYATLVGSFATSFDELIEGGGVVAQGASLAGREDGIVNTSAAITIAGVPLGSTIVQAYLYWVITGPNDLTVNFNATPVAATDLGTAGTTCWSGSLGTAARADVTALVTGDGIYTVSGLPSTTSALGPDTDGVGLVVVYSDPASMTSRRVIFRDGIITAGSELVTDTFSLLSVATTRAGRFHILVGDGQGPGVEPLTFDGSLLGTGQFQGSDGSLWDTRSYNVTLTGGTTSVSWTHANAGDCLTFTAAILDYTEDPVCGNGVVQSGEQCDDGNISGGDCCSSTCQFEADGSACASDGNACTADACDGSGVCEHQGPIAEASCLVAPNTKFTIKDSATASKDKLSWQWNKGEAFDQSDLGTPEVDSSTSYTLCVYDTTAMVPSLEASIELAPSSALWTSKAPKGLKYKDTTGTSDGVTKAQMKTGLAGKTKVKLAAAGMNLTLPVPASGTAIFDQTPNVTVQLVNSAGTCWTSEFVVGDTKTNDADTFQAQTK